MHTRPPRSSASSTTSKQTRQRKPVPDAPRHYGGTIDDFVPAGFDEALLNRFFRADVRVHSDRSHWKCFEQTPEDYSS